MYDMKKDTRSAWFSVNEIFQFLKDNGVDPTSTNLGDFGVRIYLGMHHEHNDFKPEPSSGVKVEDYYFKDTPILVLTKKTEGIDRDQLDKGASISMAFGGTGADNARLCPPECPGDMDDPTP
jgi:hypothetical protein